MFLENCGCPMALYYNSVTHHNVNAVPRLMAILI